MLIQYYGDFCFKITTKPGGRATEEIILWTDPVDKNSGFRTVQGQADILLLSHNTSDYSNLKGNYLIFNTPGEYASHGFTLRGLPSFRDTENGNKRGQNTLFTFSVEDLSLCFLGALGHPLAPEQHNLIGQVDILFIPVGGNDTLDIHLIDEVIRKIEPNLIIPMHYRIDDSLPQLSPLPVFCKEIGNCPPTTVSKLNIKKKDLEGKSMEIVLFEKM